MAGFGVGDVAHLRIRNMQEFRQLRPVCGGLVEQQQKFRVGQHEAGRLGAQALLHILGRCRHNARILPKPLPGPVEKFPGVDSFVCIYNPPLIRKILPLSTIIP